MDIFEQRLLITEITLVFKNTMPKTSSRRVRVSGRHSDAFVYILDGSCRYVFSDGKEFTARKDDVFYLPYKSSYTMYLGAEDYRFIYCDFKFADTDASPALFPHEKTESTDALFKKLLNLYKANRWKNYIECMSVLYGIYASLCHSRSHALHKSGTEALANRAKERIEESFNDPLFSLSSLSDEIKVSEVYLRRLFKDSFGMSPVKYLTSARLNNARELMNFPFLSLDECARKSGFATVQYFGRVFKKQFGISPGRYRSDTAK